MQTAKKRQTERARQHFWSKFLTGPPVCLACAPAVLRSPALLWQPGSVKYQMTCSWTSGCWSIGWGLLIASAWRYSQLFLSCKMITYLYSSLKNKQEYWVVVIWRKVSQNYLKSSLFLFICLFAYLFKKIFLAALGLHSSTWAFSLVAVSRGYSSLRWLLLLRAQALGMQAQ